jgi:hypothetical protein
MAQFPLFFSPFGSPLPPLCPLLLTWHPPAVTGIVHLSLRLLVNWPHLPHPSPNSPFPSKLPEPQLPSALLRRPREYSGSCYPEQLYHEIFHQKNMSDSCFKGVSKKSSNLLRSSNLELDLPCPPRRSCSVVKLHENVGKLIACAPFPLLGQMWVRPPPPRVDRSQSTVDIASWWSKLTTM